MVSELEDLSVEYIDNGIQTVKQLDRQILSKGAWTTIIFRYQDWDRNKNDFGPDKFTIRRYQKRNGEYQQKSKFNISSADQAKKLIQALESWLKNEPLES